MDVEPWPFEDFMNLPHGVVPVLVPNQLPKALAASLQDVLQEDLISRYKRATGRVITWTEADPNTIGVTHRLPLAAFKEKVEHISQSATEVPQDVLLALHTAIGLRDEATIIYKEKEGRVTSKEAAQHQYVTEILRGAYRTFGVFLVLYDHKLLEVISPLTTSSTDATITAISTWTEYRPMQAVQSRNTRYL
ncbi:hypothetical protein N0V83_005251 [Neocucurbitaria cava]|uniref:DUF6604 domain-containing protein n=1 Tax=Neocucurbitaria cava TaxID=798079 RepID=A0A9W8Y971_9PLEO|nr:hypothetical protein N0V83_005251 [Neocucurbitaria cava]